MINYNKEEFFEKWYEYFANFAAGRLSVYSSTYKSPKDPEVLDYVHDAYMKAMKPNKETKEIPYDTFKGTENNRKTWFCVLIINCMKDKFKSSSNQSEVMMYDMKDIRDSTKRRSKRNSDVVKILKLLKDRMSEALYKVVILKTLDLTNQEVSDILGIPINTVSSRIRLIRNKRNNQLLFKIGKL